MNPSRLFILRPIATALIMVALLLCGILGYRLLPVSALPEVEYPTIRTSTFYPGASPEVMASLITAPLERQFGQMAGLKQMTSSSSFGASIITLMFNLDTNLDVAEQEVQAAINAAASYLPKDLPYPPIYNKVNPADTPIMTLALTSKTLPLSEVEDFADTRFSQKISQISGVGLVSITGGQRPAIRVQCNPQSLSAYGLTLENVRTTLMASSVNQPKGSFDGPKQSSIVNANDQLNTSQEFQSLILAYRNGAPIRLSDVARVFKDVEDNKQAAWMNTTPAVIINIQRQPGANVIDVADRIKRLLATLSNSLPADINVAILSDRTATIRSSVEEAQKDLLLSVILVVLVIFLFLRSLSATLIPSIAIPISLIGTFSIMYLLGFSLNNLTLMALTIAAGFVVDDAIVMIENIARYRETGESGLDAAIKGSQQIGFTIMSLTASLIAVMIPLLFMQDIIGRLFREFALTMTITILLSAFISLTLTPMLCARLLHPYQGPKEGKDTSFSHHWQQKILTLYATSLQQIFQYPKAVLIAALSTLTLTGCLFYGISKGFFPLQDTGLIQGISEAPQSISFPAMAERQQNVAKLILQDPDVESLSSFIGIDGTNMTLNSGRFLINLKPLAQRHDRVHIIIERLQEKLRQLPDIKIYLQPVQDLTIDNRVTRAQYQYSLNTPEDTQLAHWTDVLVKYLQAEPKLKDVSSDLQNNGKQNYITIDRDTASQLGITTQQIADSLYDAFGQRQVLTLFTNVNQYHVVLEVLPELQQLNHALDHIYFTSSTGKSIPLRTFTKITQKTGPLIINHQGQFPVATLSFNLAPKMSLSDAIKAIDHAKEAVHLPNHIITSFEGTAQTFQNALANEGWLILAAIIVVYIVLGILYESYIHPITILSTLPCASMGALCALIMTGNELSIVALIGIILLIGIVMKNAIMMIDFALEQERIHNKSPKEAIYDACLLRFRPIIMTTMAALLGAIPLAFSSGMGAELRQPLGIAIIGGLIVSQILTLYTTPIIYLTFDHISQWAKSWHFFGMRAEEADVS